VVSSRADNFPETDWLVMSVDVIMRISVISIPEVSNSLDHENGEHMLWSPGISRAVGDRKNALYMVT
jgi:hypothetical protein